MADIDVQELKRSTLAIVPEDKAFWVCRGDRIQNVCDLANCIESLSPEQFKHHVEEAKKTTHFSEWISSVLNNPLLAHDIDLDPNWHDQGHLVKTIRDHINWLEHAQEHIVHANF